MNFSRQSILIDAAAESDRITKELRRVVRQVLRRSGAVVGISGGVDSAVVLALAVRAFGAGRVVAVMLPERDSDPESERLARELAAQFGIDPLREEITGALEGFGCYRRRDEAIGRACPGYDAAAGYRAKIVLPPDLLNDDTLNTFSVVVLPPGGGELKRPLRAADFLQIVAASNFKQRTRMSFLYYHAELRNYAVIGTANRNEHNLGFFVKHGDAGVDVNAIGHLYKTQVYQLAQELGIPDAIRRRTPTSDTYSAPCDQQEFFFRLPFETLDLLWHAQENGVAPEIVAEVMGLTALQVRRAFEDFTRKQRATDYLRFAPLSL